MSSHNFGLDYVESDRLNPSDIPDIPSSDIFPPTASTSQVTVVQDGRRQLEPEPSSYHGSPSPSSQPTAVPYAYAPTPPPAPTPPSIPSESEIYGPDRLFGQPSTTTNENVGRALIPSPTRYDTPSYDTPRHYPMTSPQELAFSNQFKDELTRAAGVVTPGVDDGPYIRYALDAMTRVPDDGRIYPSGSDQSYQYAYHFTPTSVPSPLKPASVHLSPQAGGSGSARYWPLVPTPGPNPVSPAPTAEEELLERRQRRQTREEMEKLLSEPWDTPQQLREVLEQPSSDPWYEVPVADTPLESRPATAGRKLAPSPRIQRNPNVPEPRTLEHWQPRPDVGADPEIALHGVRNALRLASPLNRKPWVLRWQSLLLLAILCVLMIAALIFCAVYSVSYTGFTPYSGTIYGGQYFLFRILPQLVAVFLLIYAQCIISAAFWVLPFSAMAADARSERRGAVFLPLYPKSFLWPQLYGNWYIWIPIFNVWLLNFTIPLQSCLFTVILVDGAWTWATVQGVAWTLVALYVSFLLALGVIFIFWHERRTGMQQWWGIRTLADILFLVSQSNSLPQYRGLEVAPTRRSMKQRLSGSAERLGFWFAAEAPQNGTWYGIGAAPGEEEEAAEKPLHQQWANRQRPESPDVGERPSPSTRSRYLPWCFRDGQIIFFAVASSILLIALIVVSFLRSTDLRNGFLPLLSAGPVAGAFSAADFLYSFIPSLIGLVLFLLFQPLDLGLRILTPWGELARAEGSRAETSILLDYSVCLPFESTVKALRNKHWRVAFVSFLAPLFALLPVLGGGLFLALTPASGVVRMYPNVPAFAIILALLFLYVGGLVCLVPNRKQFRLPHAVTCLAEIISFCCNEQVRTDEAFDLERMLRPRDLEGRLDVGKDWHRQGRWAFGAGRNSDERLGIKRYSKFTVNPKKLRSLYDRRARGELISTPLARNSGSLYG